MNLLKNTKIIVLHPGTTINATDVDCTTLADMSGCEGILLMCGNISSTAGGTTGTLQLVPRHSAVNSSTTGITDLGSTSYGGTTALSTSHIGHVAAVDVYRPLKRYIGATVNKTGANVLAMGPVIGLQYGIHKGPIAQSTSYVVGTAKQCVSPTT